jgi:energy-coupling factor transporter ATP-binding protein EcfA2
MKIERVRLKNFCGVDEVEVRLSPTGVTLIHGPNEAGKSTLMTAVDVLFDHRDDSRREEVRNTKHVSKDVGAEVEADIEIGDYRFTYFKRFHKDRETVLKIHSPRAENLSGREAHERVRQILDGSVDTGLWQALRILQGGILGMPALHDQRALSEALDRAAGQAEAGDKENALFEAAYAEYGQYYTDTGREKEPSLGQARSRAAEATAKEQVLQSDLTALEAEVTRHATLEKSLVSLKRRLAGLDASQARAQETWETVSKLTDGVERALSAKQLADHAVQRAQGALEQRNELIDQGAVSAKKVQDAESLHDQTAAALDSATESLSEARTKRDLATATATRRDAEESIRRADLEFREEEFELVRMQERLQHVTDADDAAAQASAIVSATKITEQLRNEIRTAEVRLKTEQGILNSASPKISITSLESVPITIDGEALTLQAGQAREFPVNETVSVRIGSVAEVRVEPGTSADALKQAVADAESALAKACAQAGVANAEEAETAWASLADAKRTLADRDRVTKEHLRDLTRKELDIRIQASKAKVDAYEANRTSEIALPSTSDECKALLGSATTAAAEARADQMRAEAVFGEVQEYHTRCREEHARSSATLEREQQDQRNAVRRLEQARALSSDAALASALETAEANAETASANFTAAENWLEGADPESAKSMLETATTAAKAAREQFDAQDRELIGLRTKLDLVGDKGLAEALAESKRVAFEAEDSLARLQRRALAAELLYETLSAERQAMRRAYVAPLRDGIERLGRHVFGSTFRVDVDERLQVVSRTVDGVTVSVKQLSTGAQEQLGLLVRLAAASMVSNDGGVPLVLDDALGSTDEDRLETMGAVLRVASQDTQTIIITCAPERYIHCGAQSSVALSRTAILRG